MRNYLVLTFLLLSLSPITCSAVATQNAWNKTKSAIETSTTEALGKLEDGAMDTVRAGKMATKKASKAIEENAKGLWQSFRDMFK